MTKEKFEKLADQMCEIPITNYDILCKMIYNVYEKAIFEPAFGDIYAELCTRLSQQATQNPFVHIIESDEEPPTEDGEVGQGDGESSNYTVFRWSNDVDTNDSEIVGPFDNVEDCFTATMDSDVCPDPIKRDDMELVLDSLRIKSGTFIKIMRSKDDPSQLYTVFFPMSKIAEVGQQVSGIFLSHRECEKDASKENGFRGILLNKCQEEFFKQNVYDDWKKEKKVYEEEKDKLSDRERLEKEEELEFRRMKIKKQVLGNIHFIGELFKKDMLKPKIMRYCIEYLLKLEETESGELRLLEDDMDDEDHEAICKLFTTIGKALDIGKMRSYIHVYFERINSLSNDKKNLSARSRFMYKDLIELRNNKWIARREVETAKTLEEIKRDFERDERIAAQQSQQLNNNYRNNRNKSGGRGGKNDYRDDRRDQHSGNRQRSQPNVDTDGFEVVGSRGYAPANKQFPSGTPKILSRKPSGSKISEKDTHSKKSSASAPAPLSKEKLENRVKSIKNEFVGSKDVKELLMSLDELSSTPNSGKTLVQINLDTALDCKEDERNGIFSMFKILYEKNKLSPTDIKEPLGEIIEFIGSFVVDSPMVVQYVGEIVADFVILKALDMVWFCEQARKLEEFDGHLIAPLVELAILKLIERLGYEKVTALVSKDESTFVSLLGSDRWKQMRTNNNLN